VHHWHAIGEDVHPGEFAVVEEVRAPLAFQKLESQQHDRQRHELERVGDELLGQPKGRICYDRFGAGRCADFAKEVATEVKPESAVNEVAGNDFVTGGPEHADDAAGARARLPNATGQPLGTQQGFDRACGRLVKIESSLRERMTAGISCVR
jgi:hypothetical protein